MKKEGRQEEAQGLFCRPGPAFGQDSRIWTSRPRKQGRLWKTGWLPFPTFPDASVPVGQDESENVEIDRWGAIPEFSFEPRDHADLGAALGLDFERAARLARQPFCRGIRLGGQA